ncbi:MAG: DUF2167 domain-containing protein [Myxococcota bacterium]
MPIQSLRHIAVLAALLGTQTAMAQDVESFEAFRGREAPAIEAEISPEHVRQMPPEIRSAIAVDLEVDASDEEAFVRAYREEVLRDMYGARVAAQQELASLTPQDRSAMASLARIDPANEQAMLDALTRYRQIDPSMVAPEIRAELAVAYGIDATNDEAIRNAIFQEQAAAMEQENLEASFERQSGAISLRDGLARIDVPAELEYIGPADADRLIQAWQNPPMPDNLGMLVPRDRSLFGEQSWAVLLTFAEDGWVDDDDAEDLDYDELLEEMQAGQEDANEQRRALGLPGMEVVGWAEPPHYDSQTHRLYWAQHLRSTGGYENLNYAIRVLGRRGVLELNAVADVNMLGEMRTKMEGVLAGVHFEQGHRYEDFDPDIDEVAAYGIGALILGKFAGKAGFFALILAFLVKAKKLLILVVVGIFAAFRRFFGRGRGTANGSKLDDYEAQLEYEAGLAELDDIGDDDPPQR